jgi:hypothetical protein
MKKSITIPMFAVNLCAACLCNDKLPRILFMSAAALWAATTAVIIAREKGGHLER